jgi:hypothetical protein
MNMRGLLSTLLLTAVSMALSFTVVILAPLPLMLLRRNGGRLSLLIATLLGFGVLTGLGVYSAALMFGGASLVTWIFCECESQNIGYSASIGAAVLALAGVMAVALGYGIHSLGFDPKTFVDAQLDLALTQLKMPAEFTVDKASLMKQLPSGLVIMVVVSMWLNTLLSVRMERWLGWVPLAQKHFFVKSDLLRWKMPDEMVWLALASAAGAFFNLKPEWLSLLSLNVFNVVVMLYFFQGLAIIASFFVTKRVGPFWRWVAYFFIFSQFYSLIIAQN